MSCAASWLLNCRMRHSASGISTSSFNTLMLTHVSVPPQNNVLGAYPFHWHFAGDASGQMATDNSVYR